MRGLHGLTRNIGLLAQIAEFWLLREKLDEMGNLAVAASDQRFLNTTDDRAKFGGIFGIQFFHFICLLRNNVVRVFSIELDLIKAGTVVKITKADEAHFLKCGETAIDGYKIAGGVSEVTMNLFDTRWLGPLDQGFKDRDARLGNPQSSCF